MYINVKVIIISHGVIDNKFVIDNNYTAPVESIIYSKYKYKNNNI